MELGNEAMVNALNASVKELQQCLDLHCTLVGAILTEEVDEHRLLPLKKGHLKHSRTLQLKEALKEAIHELEESRKAFKSKRLEALRKKLTRVLIDSD